MSLIVQNNKIVFIGQVKDIINMFADYPAETTLLEFINLHLH